MSMQWFKLHHEIIHDIKLRRFSVEEKWAWITLLCLASQSSKRGVIEAEDDDIADICEFKTSQDWLYFKDKLRAKGMINPVSGGLEISNWEKRQYDKPSDRPSAVRERKQKQRGKAITGHADVTLMSRDVTRCHDTEQTREEEIRGEKNRQDSENGFFEKAERGEPKQDLSSIPGFDSDEFEPCKEVSVQTLHEKPEGSAAAPPIEKKPFDPMGDRFRSGGNPYSAYGLVAEGLGHLWVGPGRSDFDPILMVGATAYKKGLEQPSDKGRVEQYIRNCIRDARWGDLESRYEEGQEIERRRSQMQQVVEASTESRFTSAPVPEQVGEPATRRITDLFPAQYRKRIEEVKEKTRASSKTVPQRVNQL